MAQPGSRSNASGPLLKWSGQISNEDRVIPLTLPRKQPDGILVRSEAHWIVSTRLDFRAPNANPILVQDGMICLVTKSKPPRAEHRCDSWKSSTRAWEERTIDSLLVVYPMNANLDVVSSLPTRVDMIIEPTYVSGPALKTELNAHMLLSVS